MRYLGGGIGHLEQFTPPPEDVDDEDITIYLNNEVELDSFTLDKNAGSANDSGEEEIEEGEDSEDDEEDDDKEDEEESDLDEEAGNVY